MPTSESRVTLNGHDMDRRTTPPDTALIATAAHSGNGSRCSDVSSACPLDDLFPERTTAEVVGARRWKLGATSGRSAVVRTLTLRVSDMPGVRSDTSITDPATGNGSIGSRSQLTGSRPRSTCVSDLATGSRSTGNKLTLAVSSPRFTSVTDTAIESKSTGSRYSAAGSRSRFIFVTNLATKSKSPRPEVD